MLAAIQLSNSQDAEWFPDTGASSHITAKAGNLTNLIPYHETDSVMIGNGKCLPISHIGEGKIYNGTTVLPSKNVLLAPTIKM